MTDALSRLLDAADVSGWTGLPADAAETLGIVAGTASTFDGLLGDPPAVTSWVPLATRSFSDGLRAWVREGRVVLVEGVMPVDGDGGLLAIPELGEPDAELDHVFGPLTITGGERVYAARGLAVCVNPNSGVLLAVRGYAPTTPEDYRRRLRPVPVPELRFAGRGAP
ncbi:hypothetical protein [Microbacterium trichothecenolyticum]|uniref:Uncharacterized protein n=1 Tax=Microbacterium trichothecenolyticum TaxID=69370 RepID=A0A0M2HBD2_MICTR|nr:hypothetical protein [Microbacterium trichothecenolyticum]KJL41949.1 hypothetical protein RS82_02566 [Microbacterium trichothecenolyticum]